MPRIDVSELLTDPDFVETGLTCTRTPRTLVKGRTVDGVPVVSTFAGVVVPDDGKTFARAPDATDVADAQLIYTKFRLQAADVEANVDADTVTTTRGDYRVKKTKDFSQFGAGFIVALCEKAAR